MRRNFEARLAKLERAKTVTEIKPVVFLPDNDRGPKNFDYGPHIVIYERETDGKP
jgi:hypothetical protein